MCDRDQYPPYEGHERPRCGFVGCSHYATASFTNEAGDVEYRCKTHDTEPARRVAAEMGYQPQTWSITA